MYLKKIEIYGFKSFADRIELDFNQGITGVVGPNGSGKSNIADAIKWVLGEQKVKSLRGSKMEDVIFAGTIARKPLGYAEVTLVLNNEEGSLPLDYDEISVTRRLYRSGESEYLINKTPCRLKDVQDLFADTGLGKEGYSIIGQGKIDSIVSSNPQDIRHLFDEAAGIVKFKNRKQESERKLERTVDNIHRVTDIVLELEKQLIPLKRQRKKAQIYLEHADELKKIELNVFVNRTEQIDAQLQLFYRQRQESQEQLEEKKNQIDQTDDQYQQIRREMVILEEQIDAINQEMLDLSQRTERFNTDIQVSKANIKNGEERKVQYEEEKKDLEEKLQRVTLALEEIMKQKESQGEAWKVILQQVQQIQAEKDVLDGQIQQMQQETRDRERHLQDRRDRIQELLQEMALTEGHGGYAKDRIQELEAEVGILRVSLEHQHQQLEVRFQKKKTLADLQHQQMEALKDIQTRVDQIASERDGHLARRHLLLNNLASERSKLHMLEEDQDAKGYYRSVKNLLAEKATIKGIHDIVGNLLHVSDDLSIAVETALGGTFQHMVVQDDGVAKVCIRILNEKKWGRATFLPMSAIKSKRESLPADLSGAKGVLGLAIDLIDFDKTYEPIFAQVLGRTLIVEDLDTGMALSRNSGFKGKIVTRKGEIFHPGGAIVGGHFNKNNLLLQRNNHIHSLRQTIQEMDEELKIVEAALPAISQRFAQEEGLRKEEERRIHAIDTDMRLLDQEILSQEQGIQTDEQKALALQETVAHNQQWLLTSQEKIQALNEEHQRLLQIAQENPQQDLSQERVSLESQRDLRGEALNEHRVEAARMETLYRGLEAQEKTLLDSLQELTLQTQRKEEQIQGLTTQVEEEQRLIVDRSQVMTDAEKLAKSNHDALTEKQQLRKEKNARFDFLENELKGFNHERMLLSDTLNKLELRINANELEKEHLSENIFEDYQMTYLMAQEYRYPVENMELEMRSAKALKDRIKGLGNINVGAIEQYEEVRDRFAFLTEQREDLLRAREELKMLIKDISKDIEVQFIDQFRLIQTEFNKTFKNLFNGGNAGLLIMDDENIMDTGIEIVAQPPGKKLKNITLLSGGEKSLTAIALLFAIIGIKPAPFCVLDEIDAALDDSNVDRFAEFLGHLNKENQFITITHRKGTMEIADRLYGVTMGRDGVSKMLSVQLSDIV